MHAGAIPSTLSEHLCIDFVNSRFEDYKGSGHAYDRLELQEWQRWFMARSGLGRAPALDPASRSELIELRDLLRRGLEARDAPAGADLAKLNDFMARSCRTPELVAGAGGAELRNRWTEGGWRALMAAVAESFARLVVGGAVERVRVCANPDCSYVFCDESRNRSRRWCDVAVCGNLMRVRRHRAAGAGAVR